MSSISIPVYSEAYGGISETISEVYYNSLPEFRKGSWDDEVGGSVNNKFRKEADGCATAVRLAWDKVGGYAKSFNCKQVEYKSRSSEINSLRM
ncbi:MAG: hypothetical protein ACI4MN_03230 [Candidatus Coproplasma sp.]